MFGIFLNLSSRKLDLFLDKAVFNYKKGRDFPSMSYTSKLSYIRFGMISVNRIWNCLEQLNQDKNITHYNRWVGESSPIIYCIISHIWNTEICNLNLMILMGKFKRKFDLWKKVKQVILLLMQRLNYGNWVYA